jgi:hypothetical protein
MAAPVIFSFLFIVETGDSIPPDPASPVRLDISFNKPTHFSGIGSLPTITMIRSNAGPDIVLTFNGTIIDGSNFGLLFSAAQFTAVVDTTEMHGETFTVNSSSIITDFDQFIDVDGTPAAAALPANLLSVLNIVGVPITIEGHIRHRFTASGPNDPTVEISSDAINDSFVVNGGDVGQVMIRDAFQPDGWGFASLPSRAPRVTSIVSSATPTPNADTDDLYTLTALAEDATFATPEGTPANGQKLLIRVLDDGTTRALIYSSDYANGGAALPSTTIPSKTLRLELMFNADNGLNKWQCVGVVQEI